MFIFSSSFSFILWKVDFLTVDGESFPLSRPFLLVDDVSVDLNFLNRKSKNK